MSRNCSNIIFFVADGTMEAILHVLLHERFRSLNIIPEFTRYTRIITHPNHDPGLYENVELIRQLTQYSEDTCTLVMLDEQWDGSPGKEEIESKIRQDLAKINLANNEVIVISPSIDLWAWTGSRCFLKEINWDSGFEDLLEFLTLNGYEIGNFCEANDICFCPKPKQPKESLVFMLNRISRPLAREFFINIAKCASLQRCCIESFLRFKSTVQYWSRILSSINPTI